MSSVYLERGYSNWAWSGRTAQNCDGVVVGLQIVILKKSQSPPPPPPQSVIIIKKQSQSPPPPPPQAVIIKKKQSAGISLCPPPPPNPKVPFPILHHCHLSPVVPLSSDVRVAPAWPLWVTVTMQKRI